MQDISSRKNNPVAGTEERGGKEKQSDGRSYVHVQCFCGIHTFNAPAEKGCGPISPRPKALVLDSQKTCKANCTPSKITQQVVHRSRYVFNKCFLRDGLRKYEVLVSGIPAHHIEEDGKPDRIVGWRSLKQSMCRRTTVRWAHGTVKDGC